METEKYQKEWNEKISLIENHMPFLNSWECDFIDNISDLLFAGGELSFRQSKTLRKIHRMVSNRLG
jgi:hypothetical protein